MSGTSSPGAWKHRKPYRSAHGFPARLTKSLSLKALRSRKATCCSRLTRVRSRLKCAALEAQLAQTKAAATRSDNEAQRGERLRQSNAISAELADSRTTAAQEARAAVAGIQAQLDLAKLNLSFTRVTAPISGRVSRAEITAGNLVTADTTALTSVVSTDKVYAYFDADERVFLKYTELARQGRRGATTPVYLGLSNETGNPHLGQMNFVDNQVNPATGTIRGRAVFDNSKGEYTPACMRASSWWAAAPTPPC